MYEHKWEHRAGITYRCTECGTYGKDRRGTGLSNETEKPVFIEDALRHCNKVDLANTMTLRVSMELEGAHFDQTIEVPSFKILDEMKAASMSGLDAEAEWMELVSNKLHEELTRRMLAALFHLRRAKT